MIPSYEMFPEGLSKWELNMMISLDSISRETDVLIEFLLKCNRNIEDTSESIDEASESIDEAQQAYQKAINLLGN